MTSSEESFRSASARRPIRQHTQGREQFGPLLHFIQDDEPLQRLQGQQGVRQLGEVFVVLQVKRRDRPRADDADHWMTGEQAAQRSDFSDARIHNPNIALKSR
jgi:hypothetical protein